MRHEDESLNQLLSEGRHSATVAPGPSTSPPWSSSSASPASPPSRRFRAPFLFLAFFFSASLAHFCSRRDSLPLRKASTYPNSRVSEREDI